LMTSDPGLWRRDHYLGGHYLYIGAFGQSYDRKTAYAQAFAKVLTDAGISAYATSRID